MASEDAETEIETEIYRNLNLYFRLQGVKIPRKLLERGARQATGWLFGIVQPIEDKKLKDEAIAGLLPKALDVGIQWCTGLLRICPKEIIEKIK